MKYSIVIATYNRAADLRETLKSLAGLHADGPWEVIVVDNNSPDDTRQVVLDAAPSFPVPLRYRVHQLVSTVSCIRLVSRPICSAPLA